MSDNAESETKYVYCSYWNIYDRVISEEDGMVWVVSLTAVNHGIESEWERRSTEIIRHYFVNSTDRVSTSLPPGIEELMKQNMGPDVTKTLLTFDYEGKIDKALYEEKAGAPPEPFDARFLVVQGQGQSGEKRGPRVQYPPVMAYSPVGRADH